MRWILSLAAVCLCGCAATPATERPSVYRNLPYVADGHSRQVGDLHIPVAANGTAVIVVHGGGWSRGDKRDIDDHVDALVKRGYAVWAINYRLAPEFRYPAAIDDIRSAHRWLLAHARDYGLSVEHIAVYGYSAGGHLALLHGTTAREHGLQIDAMISGAGPSDLRRYPTGPYTERLFGGPMRAYPAAYADASPITHVSMDDPPGLLFHGTWDRLVDPDQSVAMVDALNAAGAPARYQPIAFGTHFSTFIFERTAMRATLDFLASTLNIRARPENTTGGS